VWQNKKGKIKKGENAMIQRIKDTIAIIKCAVLGGHSLRGETYTEKIRLTCEKCPYDKYIPKV
jgi:hypothetical protein